MATIRERVAPAAVAVAVLAAGLATRGLDAPGADKLGDGLYAALVLAGLWLLAPRARLATLAAAALTWCVAVEFLQLTAVPDAAADRLPASRLVLGAGFDPFDLPAYAAGVVAAAGLVATIRHRARAARHG